MNELQGGNTPLVACTHSPPAPSALLSYPASLYLKHTDAAILCAYTHTNTVWVRCKARDGSIVELMCMFFHRGRGN